MKKSKKKLIQNLLEKNGIDTVVSKKALRRAKRLYNKFSHLSKAKVG